MYSKTKSSILMNTFAMLDILKRPKLKVFARFIVDSDLDKISCHSCNKIKRKLNFFF